MKKRSFQISLFFLTFLFTACLALYAQTASDTRASQVFRAGASISNITPKIGTSINGNMQDVMIREIHDETHARSIVLDDGQTRLAIVVSDLCMVYRETLDKAKLRAHEQTGIPVENMLMSATHTHSAGTACSVFQSDPDEDYLVFLSERIADAVIRANNHLAPARIGWGVGEEPTQVFNRRWKMKPGTPMPNPFGGEDKVKMNPGVGNPNLLEPAGPIDPEVSVISIQSADGQPIALLANYSLHYVGGTGPGEVSADYFGMFANRMQQMLGADYQNSPFVAIMSNGTSGDINNIHWAGEKQDVKSLPYHQMQVVANTVAAEAYKVVQNIQYQDWISLDTEQEEISLGVRLPDAEEVERAKKIMAQAEGPVMKTREEIYARETVLLNDYPEEVSVILQTFRLSDLAITAIPCEVFVEIGLDIKKQSPFQPTFTISLANGYNGYLPTPEQHTLGGYETWRARSSYLEVDAAPKITETLFDLLDKLNISQKTSYQGQSEAIPLFNGKNLEGWYTFLKDRGRDHDPKKVFTVNDGLLRISGEEWGCITTEQEYENYKLVVEFKWGRQTYEPRADKARDNGVLLHSTGKDGAYSGTWMHSIECQIIEGGTGDFLVVGDKSEQFALTAPVAPEKQGSSHIFQPGGQPVTIHGGRINWYGRDPNWKDVKGFRSENDIENPVGEWNRMECIADGEEVFIYLNGTLVNHATHVKPAKGRIQIQSEGAEMFVRKVELMPLPED